MDNIDFETVVVQDSELKDLTTDKEGKNKIGVGYSLHHKYKHKCTDNDGCKNGIIVPMYFKDSWKDKWKQDLIDTAEDDKKYTLVTVVSREMISVVLLEKEN